MADSKQDTDSPSEDEKANTELNKGPASTAAKAADATKGAESKGAESKAADATKGAESKAADATKGAESKGAKANAEKSDDAKAPSGKPADKETEAAKEKGATPASGASELPAKKKPKSSRAAQAAAAPAIEKGVNRSFVIGAGALVLGLAGGWVGHENRSRLMPQKEAAAAAEGADSCKAWEKQVCDATGGEQSPSCMQAQAAGSLLTPELCTEAQGQLPAILAAVKAGRADCDKLVTKLCTELGKETSTCKMVEERTDMFPAERCGEMLEHYDQVIGELKQIEAQGGPGAAQGRPPSAHPGTPPGMPPGAHPGMPPGAGQSVPPGSGPATAPAGAKKVP